MTRNEHLRDLSGRIQNLRERIAAADEECPMSEDESELQCLEQKLEMLTGENGRGRERSFG